MIVLDTNVVSELMLGSRGDARVIAWMRGLGEQPVTTVINRSELLAGVALLPAGRRREGIAAGLERLLSDLVVCLPFTMECSAAYAGIIAARTAAGRPIGTMGALVASIALVSDAAVATRDTAGFAGLGLRLADPWA